MQKEPQWRASLRSLCLKKLNDFGGRATARQIAENIGLDIGNVSPRLTELAELGAIRDTGERIRAGRGRPQVVWEVVDLAGGCDAARCDSSSVTDQADTPKWFQRYGN